VSPCINLPNDAQMERLFARCRATTTSAPSETEVPVDGSPPPVLRSKTSPHALTVHVAPPSPDQLPLQSAPITPDEAPAMHAPLARTCSDTKKERPKTLATVVRSAARHTLSSRSNKAGRVNSPNTERAPHVVGRSASSKPSTVRDVRERFMRRISVKANMGRETLEPGEIDCVRVSIVSEGFCNPPAPFLRVHPTASFLMMNPMR